MNGSGNPAPEPRPAASLTSSLLARRGGARPAMRRQPILPSLSAGAHHDDLGWNDMGEDHGANPKAVHSVVEPISDSVAPVEGGAPAVSPIAEQINALTERLTAPRVKIAKLSLGKAVKVRPAKGHKAAFTLRIEPERHLRLRLLSTLTRRSAQQLLTEALDTIIAQNQELRALAEQVEGQKALTAGKRTRKK